MNKREFDKALKDEAAKRGWVFGSKEYASFIEGSFQAQNGKPADGYMPADDRESYTAGYEKTRELLGLNLTPIQRLAVQINILDYYTGNSFEENATMRAYRARQRHFAKIKRLIPSLWAELNPIEQETIISVGHHSFGLRQVVIWAGQADKL